ncbi:MAG: glycosyltransferase family 2 protein [Terriglobia bacterium]
MPEPILSVIIPTYNRKAILKKALDAYSRQSAREKILEILVVDDGSADGTGGLVSQFAATSPVPVRCLSQRNGGLAAARNHGIREARGELLLFTDDDVIPSPNLVAEHLAWHARYPDIKTGVLGTVPYSPEVRPTPFQKWWGLDGIRFYPPYLYPGKGVSFWMMLFCNTSVKAKFLREIGTFDENFRTFGYEDLDFAYQLVKKGGQVLFNPDAVGYHYKRVSFSDASRLREKSAAARRYFRTKESGRKLAELEKQWENSRSHRTKVMLARSVVPILAPLKPLLDYRIPLPGRLYDIFYTYYRTP